MNTKKEELNVNIKRVDIPTKHIDCHCGLFKRGRIAQIPKQVSATVNMPGLG